MKKEYAPRSIRSLFAIMAALLIFSWSVNAAHADSNGAQLSIAGNGQTMVRNANITAIDGMTITAESIWGDMKVIWTIQTDGSTKFYPEGGREALFAQMKIGDEISFSGMLETLEQTPTVRVTYLKDTTLENDNAVEQGTVLSVDPDAAELALLTDIGTTTVDIRKATVIERDGDPISLSDISPQSNVQVSGSLNFVTRHFAADKITLTSTSTGESVSIASPGLFTRFWEWIDGSNHGAMTIK